MLDELCKIIAARASALDLSPLRERFGVSTELTTPAESFDAAQALCRIALERLPSGSAPISPAEQGADLLIRFIAEMPDSLAHSIQNVPAFVPQASRAWLEPQLDPFVSLACTVQDVWAHLLGPESGEDAAIVAALLWHRPRTVFDFGCGAGHFAHVLAVTGIQVDGLEVDPLKRAFFEYRAQASGLAGRMRLGCRCDSYDMVLAINVLDHMEDPAPTLAAFATAITPGSVLCTLAAFPSDDWHQSDPAVVTACARHLWENYTLSHYPDALPPWMDCWVRRTEPLVPMTLASRPRMNPGSVFHREGDGQIILHANRFYSQPLTLDDYTAEVCSQFDGRNSVADVADQTEVDPDELLNLCTLLLQTRHLCCESGDKLQQLQVAQRPLPITPEPLTLSDLPQEYLHDIPNPCSA